MRDTDPSPLIELKNEILKAEVVALAGGGYIADDFYIESRQRLMLLRWSQSMGKKTVMWGQGLGPITNKDLHFYASKALKNIDLLAVRERVVSEDLAETLGVSLEKIHFTGDDAVALALPPSAVEVTNSDVLGFNLRIASYSGLLPEITAQIDSLIEQFCIEKNIDLRLIAISSNTHGNDVEAVQSLENVSKRILNQQPLSSISDLALLVASCRVVFTGSYHAAVFALASGIPVVCVAASEYYENKFCGLKAEYKQGCAVIRIDRQSISEIKIVLDDLWVNAATTCGFLRSVAEEQVKLSEAAYYQALMEI